MEMTGKSKPTPQRSTLASRLAAAALVLASTAAVAAPYPSRPITMIVPFPAGAGTDVTARAVAQCMEKNLGGGTAVVVMNRPGASGDIGLWAIASAPADGYTIGIVNTPGIVSIPIERRTRYTLANFEFLGNVADSPATINVHGDSEIKNIPDLLKYAKAHPGELQVGTQGIGSAGHIAALLLEQSADVRFQLIPFQGTSPARTALLGKIIASSTANLDEALGYAVGAPWRIVGVMSDTRSPYAPNLPTFKESGQPITGGSMRGFAAPKGLPADVATKLTGSIKACVDAPDFRQRAEKSYLPLRYLAPAEQLQELQRLDASLRALWKTRPWTD